MINLEQLRPTRCGRGLPFRSGHVCHESQRENVRPGFTERITHPNQSYSKSLFEKGDPNDNEILRQQFPAIIPGYHVIGILSFWTAACPTR